MHITYQRVFATLVPSLTFLSLTVPWSGGHFQNTLIFSPLISPHKPLLIINDNTVGQILGENLFLFSELFYEMEWYKNCYPFILPEFVFKGTSSDVYQSKQYLKDCGHIQIAWNLGKTSFSCVSF